ncbi:MULTISPECIES: hypothetical protein [Streptomyces]|uniref:Uncharacterized protein n=1 Tax=Streptomyces spinosisporus TaxID=2927582 RepID=A0ABS9XMR9_9ACTN|nr:MULTISPECIES: hypothetical protein [Streptomyces]MCI3243377.1 hypothetical protein [Streptomyces spinosisporus]WUB40721.1 hypothetical protein OHN38_39605 [Streptomyces sp. NBC_00588]
MNTAERNHSEPLRHSEKAGPRIPRILAVGAALGLACAALAGAASPAMAAAPRPDGPAKATADHRHDDRGAHRGHDDWDDDGDDCDGLIVLLCHG